VTARITIKVPPFEYHAGQRRLLAEKRRFNVACMGRRWGKTLFGIEQLAFEPGGAMDGYPVAWMSPSYKLLMEVWRDAEASLHDVTRTANKSDMRIELINGGVLDFWTLEDDKVGRGRKYRRLVVDEAAHARYLRDSWQQAILPTLTDYQGEAWFISTPAGRNFFHELYQLGNPDNPARQDDWASWTMPTSTNPHIAPEEIERMRALLPERVFAQEYEAVFLEDGGGVFRNVTACATTDPYPFDQDPGDGRAYVIGVDWGRHNDFTVITLLDAKEKRVAALDRFNKIEYAFQLARLKALHARFSRAPIMAESNSMGEPLIEQLRRDGLPIRGFQTTSASKAGIIEALAIAFERSELTIPMDKVLLEELLAFDQERMPSGAIRYGAPQGQHDDMVMSLAIAWHGLMYAHATPDYSKGGLAAGRFDRSAL
jgi:hypothetical protein